MKKLVDELQSLAQLDIDAVRAYTSAINRIDINELKENLISFRSDHQRHISDLSVLIRELGAEPPKENPDVKGFFIQGFTAIRSMTGNEGALKAMKGNEELTNKKYAEALKLDMPDHVRAVVQRNREDERRHLEYIENAIQSEVWVVKKSA